MTSNCRTRSFEASITALVLFAGPTICGCEQTIGVPAHSVIPNPELVELTGESAFDVSIGTRIAYDVGDSSGAAAAHVLADLVGNTVVSTPLVVPMSDTLGGHLIRLTRTEVPNDIGPEGYDLEMNADRVTLRAHDAAGLFYGVQTIRQLLPPLVEYTAAYVKPLPLPAGHIRDQPRYEWRGLMLDVARHFLPARDVMRFIDLMALYKMNRLHLHLADDQGWRIEIPSRPLLTEIGGGSQVGGKSGGFYTTAEYKSIVDYAAARHIIVVPEIDLPGHTNAALASYAELNCDGVARELFTGTAVGFSSVCPDRQTTFDFIDDVVRDISALTPGPYFHVGGDEVQTLSEEEYIAFVERVQTIVHSHGKRLVGWDEVSAADLGAGSRVQLWRPLWPAGNDAAMDSARTAAAAALKRRIDHAVANGVEFIASPANRIYLDMKYDTSTVIGLRWAGLSDVRNAYDWTVEEVFEQIPDSAIAGIEATLWSESFGMIHDFEYMAFPRLPGVAELGWTSADNRGWESYRQRVAQHARRWTALGVNYHRSPLIPWPSH